VYSLPGAWKVRVHHVALRVRNLGETVEFYRGVMGMPVVHVAGPEGDPRSVFLGPGLELVRDDSLPEGGCRLVHVGLKVDNPEAAVADLRARGVRFREKPRLMPAFFSDPEGVTVELV